MIAVPPIPRALQRDLDDEMLHDCLQQLVGPSLWYAAELFTGSTEWTGLTVDGFLRGAGDELDERRIMPMPFHEALVQAYGDNSLAVVPIEVARFALRLQRLVVQAADVLGRVSVPEEPEVRAELEEAGTMPTYEALVQAVQQAAELLADAGVPDYIEPAPKGARGA